MIGDAFHDIVQFHTKFGLTYDDGPRLLPPDMAEFRLKFLYEEADEFVIAHHREFQLDALVDLAYVALGTLYLHIGGMGTIMHWPECVEPSPTRTDIANVNNRHDGLIANIDAYRLAEDVTAKVQLLTSIANACETMAALAGWDFAEAWRRVHHKNMQKVRATAAEQSARGSTLDVVKPPGWQAASLVDLV